MASDVKVTVAQNAGFCFGVAGAANAVEREMGDAPIGERIFTLGKLIHNDTYNARLKAGGVLVAEFEDIERLCAEASEESPVKVFIRAHGIPKETEDLLVSCTQRNPHFSFVDCTCVFVKKIHKIVSEHNDPEGLLLVLGTASHPEVVGFCSRFDGEIFAFEKAEELKRAVREGKVELRGEKKTVLVAQTTQNLREWEKTKAFTKGLCNGALVFDTICNVTEKRQIEAAWLAKDNDFMIVIGSKGSSNSAKLYAICRAESENTVMIENAEDIERFCPFEYKKIGIVAGASTPHDIIEAVEKKISQ